MNRFYLLLVAVAVAAGVLIWMGTRPRAGSVSAAADTTVTITAADSAFQGHVLGSDSAPVEVTEYADFQCPHCAEFAVVQFPTIREQLINTGRLRWRFMEYPLGFPLSRVSAMAAECAADQGKFWEMARGLGLDLDAFNRCMADEEPAGRIEWSRQTGIARNVGGTPTFFVRGVQLNTNTYATSDAFKALVDSLTGRQ